MDQPPATLKVEAPPKNIPADSAECQADAACRRLSADAGASVFKVVTEKEVGTGWIGPDGRLITNYHVLSGGREVTAEDNRGQVYRLGKNVEIDDIDDLAAIGFVDGPPKDAHPLQIATDSPKLGDEVTQLSHRLGHSLEVTKGKFVAATILGTEIGFSPKNIELMTADWGASKLPIDREKSAFMSRRVDDFLIGGGPGSSGAPIFDSSGKVTDVHEVTASVPNHFGAIPATNVSALLSQKPGAGKFTVTSGYETGISSYFHKITDESVPHVAYDTAAPILGYTALSRMALGSSGKLGTTVSAAFLGTETYSDFSALTHSTNWRDRLANTTALVGDLTMAAGVITRYIPEASRFSTALIGAGAAIKLGSALVPNRYTIQEIKRSNADPHPAVFDILVQNNYR